MKHTKQPWALFKTDEGFDIGREREGSTKENPKYKLIAKVYSEGDARRILSSVYSCQDVPLYYLETGKLKEDIGSKIKEDFKGFLRKAMGIRG